MIHDPVKLREDAVSPVVGPCDLSDKSLKLENANLKRSIRRQKLRNLYLKFRVFTLEVRVLFFGFAFGGHRFSDLMEIIAAAAKPKLTDTSVGRCDTMGEGEAHSACESRKRGGVRCSAFLGFFGRAFRK